MVSTKDLREEFANKPAGNADEPSASAAELLAGQVGEGFKRVPPRRGWTTYAVWFERDHELMGVVGEQEKSDTDKVLAHGLRLAAGRALTLVLPEAWAYPTRSRAPWFKSTISIYTHVDGKARPRKPLRPEASFQNSGGYDANPVPHLGSTGEWAREVVEWATAHPHLDPAHTTSQRGWSCNGQRVLSISGRRALKIVAGVDAASDPAARFTVNAPMDKTDVAAVIEQVEQAIKHATSKKYGKFEEHHLQVRLRRYPETLLLESPVLREVPAYRPGATKPGRGFIDLAGLDAMGNVTIFETKLGSDEMLVLQGLDYWIWANAKDNHEALVRRLFAQKGASTNLLFAVGGKGNVSPKLGKYEKTHLELLHDDIQWRLALVEEWDSEEAPKVNVLAPRTLA